VYINAPCYSPEQIERAFGLTSLYKQGYTGRGQTIVIIGAGNTPNIEHDLKAFDKAWGLPDPPSLKIMQPYGPPTPYNCGSVGESVDGLQLEDTLDVEWSHAIAPGANIILIVGPNKEMTYLPAPKNSLLCGLHDVEQPVQYALNHHLGNIITTSFGLGELGTDTDTAVDKANEQKEYSAGDSIIKSAVSQGVTVVDASGDNGATNPSDYVTNTYWPTPNVSWPASDPYVLGVGGTSLTISDARGDYGSEVAWNTTYGTSGGGVSVLYKEPGYQQKYVANQSMLQGRRGVPDVAFPADVNYLLFESHDPPTIDANRWPDWRLPIR
jgi:subtilase family serine protease